MSDNKNLKGQQDRSLAAGTEDYELQYIANRMNVSIDEVKKAVAAAGNKREEVESYLRSHKR